MHGNTNAYRFEMNMEWNVGAIITLGLAVTSAIVWIVRLESEIKLLKSQIYGETGIIVALRNIDAKLSKVSDTVIEVRQDLKMLRKDHDEVVCLKHNPKIIGDNNV